MAAEEGHLVGHATPLIDGDDGEGASSGSFPIHCDVFGVSLHQVGVPGILGNAQIIVALFLGEGLADVWWSQSGHELHSSGGWVSITPFLCSVRRRGLDHSVLAVSSRLTGRARDSRYLEALTKRPAIAGCT